MKTYEDFIGPNPDMSKKKKKENKSTKKFAACNSLFESVKDNTL